MKTYFDDISTVGWIASKMPQTTFHQTRDILASISGEGEGKSVLEKHNLYAYLKIQFDKYYIPTEGAFSYYPKSQHATLDGTSGGIGILSDIGAFSAEKQKQLWGDPEETCIDLGTFDISILTEMNFDPIIDLESINSYRFYTVIPTDYTTNVAGVFYPRATPVLDILELVPKLKHWVNTTSQSMGNWVSREQILNRLTNLSVAPVPISRGEIPLGQLNDILQQNKTLIVIGFDVLQIPRCKITFRLQ